MVRFVHDIGECGNFNSSEYGLYFVKCSGVPNTSSTSVVHLYNIQYIEECVVSLVMFRFVSIVG